MKFSVLLPTRDRLELLAQAIETVRLQDYDDWEVIVADNASGADVCGYVASLADARIRCSRSDRALPVTDNWNRALEASRGDYIVMLGDDDGLLPGYFRRNRQAIQAFARPELLFVQGVQFAYAGTLPGFAEPHGFVANCEFLGAETEPFPLSPPQAAAAAKKSLRFQVAFPYNMQYWLFSRTLLQRMVNRASPFFQSPYPDYYAANAMLLEARQVIVQPRPLVAVGISPKSFGYYYSQGREDEGVDFLLNRPDGSKDDALREIIVPGSDMNTSWLRAMEALRANWSIDHRLDVSYWRYRYLQFRVAYSRRTSFGQFLSLLARHARIWEMALWCALHLLIRMRSLGQTPDGQRARTLTILDAVHWAYPNVRIFSKRLTEQSLLEFARNFDADGFMLECHRNLRSG